MIFFFFTRGVTFGPPLFVFSASLFFCLLLFFSPLPHSCKYVYSHRMYYSPSRSLISFFSSLFLSFFFSSSPPTPHSAQFHAP
ncbi:hypothetical protein BC940DRAFT_103194 [Gongronella butleri]|nr:hypothetical protein BC940DRAFT_103194 [Gongronella butleri]